MNKQSTYTKSKTNNRMNKALSISQTECAQNVSSVQMVELWSKLQEVLVNQFNEEKQVVKDKTKRLQQQKNKFFKVTLPKSELDKFQPNKKEE